MLAAATLLVASSPQRANATASLRKNTGDDSTPRLLDAQMARKCLPVEVFLWPWPGSPAISHKQTG